MVSEDMFDYNEFWRLGKMKMTDTKGRGEYEGGKVLLLHVGQTSSTDPMVAAYRKERDCENPSKVRITASFILISSPMVYYYGSLGSIWDGFPRFACRVLVSTGELTTRLHNL